MIHVSAIVRKCMQPLLWLHSFLLLTMFGLCSTSAGAEPVDRIRLNQIGYLPLAPKLAVVPDGGGAEFWLVDVTSGTEVLRGPLGRAQRWDAAGETVRTADFSAFTKPGRYQVRVSTFADSMPFDIRDNIYDDLLKASIKAFYFNRASVGLEERFAGIYSRPAGHPDTLVYIHPQAASGERPANTVVASPKGWYDAGDYNKYVVNSGITLYTLLKALEDHTDYFQNLTLNVPESASPLPDLLAEILWNLDWLETMQDPFDGGVYHKLSTLRFSDAVMPHTLMQPRFMMPKSTAATLNYAAVMAMAARVLKPWRQLLPGRLDRYNQAALAAWQWAEVNPRRQYLQPDGVNTGLYAQVNEDWLDERLWAATELYLTTGDKRFLKRIALPASLQVPYWAEVDALAIYSLLGAERTPRKLRRQALTLLTQAADEILRHYEQSGYRVPLVNDDFVWGSNAVAMNKALLLLYAERMDGSREYRVAARALLDYILGRNPVGYSYVTGYGSRSPMQPHHRISAADDITRPVPGFLVGGPQAGAPDGCEYPSPLPARSWLDDWCSYSTNEVAINWNAPLVYVVAALRTETAPERK